MKTKKDDIVASHVLSARDFYNLNCVQATDDDFASHQDLS